MVLFAHCDLRQTGSMYMRLAASNSSYLILSNASPRGAQWPSLSAARDNEVRISVLLDQGACQQIADGRAPQHPSILWSFHNSSFRVGATCDAGGGSAVNSWLSLVRFSKSRYKVSMPSFFDSNISIPCQSVPANPLRCRSISYLDIDMRLRAILPSNCPYDTVQVCCQANLIACVFNINRISQYPLFRNTGGL